MRYLLALLLLTFSARAAFVLPGGSSTVNVTNITGIGDLAYSNHNALAFVTNTVDGSFTNRNGGGVKVPLANNGEIDLWDVANSTWRSITAGDSAFAFSVEVDAPNFSGAGSLITSLNASQLTSGTVPLAREPNEVLYFQTNSAVGGVQMTRDAAFVDFPFRLVKHDGTAIATFNPYVTGTPNGKMRMEYLTASTVASLDANKDWTSLNNGAGVLRNNGSGTLSWDNTLGSGTVTSVGMTVPSWLTVANSPVTGSGTLAVTATTGQTASRVLATPDGSTGALALLPVTESYLSLSDVTTANVSATAHGFAPKYPNNTTTFLRGDGTWATAGTVTSVGISSPLFTIGSTPVTTSGTITVGATTDTPQFLREGLGVAADATVPLSIYQAIAASTITYGIQGSNTTVATVGAQCNTPAIVEFGSGWKTTATAGPQPVGWRLYGIPVQGATSPNEYVRLQPSTNNTWSNPFDFAPEGQTNVAKVLSLGNGGLVIVADSTVNAQTITATTSGGNLTLNGGNGPATLQLGGTSARTLLWDTTAFYCSSGDRLADVGTTANGMRAYWVSKNANLNGTVGFGFTGGNSIFQSSVNSEVVLTNAAAGTAGQYADLLINGSSALGSDQTTTSATLATTTLSARLAAGVTYTFQAEFFLSDSVAADGAKIDFNGGTATATTFIAQVTAFDTALNLSSQGTALNTAYAASTFTGNGAFEVHGTIFVNAAGTIIPQFAQNAHTTGTLTLKKGSFIRFFRAP